MSNIKAAVLAIKKNNTKKQSKTKTETIQPTPKIVNNITWEDIAVVKQNLKILIKEERKKQKLTQRKLAFKCGLSQGTIGRAENNLWISLSTLIRIVLALNKELKFK